MARVNRELADVLEDAQRALEHRIAGHDMALRAAEALGWPALLSVSVAETEARRDEARACLAAVVAVIGRDTTPAPPPANPCPTCEAEPGEPCRDVPGLHVARFVAAIRGDG